MALVMMSERLELRKRDEPKLGAIAVDFIADAMVHRSRYGGRRDEAVGVKGQWLPDVVYLDPMSPRRQKSALVRKEMRVFQLLVRAYEDADGLLAPARAMRRVVVKWPDYAPPLAGVAARASITTP